MTGSALSTASRYSLLTAAPALARFHPEAGGDARRGLQSSDTDQLLFTKSSSPAVPAPLEIALRAADPPKPLVRKELDYAARPILDSRPASDLLHQRKQPRNLDG